MIGKVILPLPPEACRAANTKRATAARAPSRADKRCFSETSPLHAHSGEIQCHLTGVSHAHLHCHARESTSIAAAITVALNAQTGAPRFFAQVLFAAANEGEHFVGGRANTAPQVYVHGLVREGRSFGLKQALMNHRPEAIGQIVAGAALEALLFSLLAKEFGKPFPFYNLLHIKPALSRITATLK